MFSNVWFSLLKKVDYGNLRNFYVFLLVHMIEHTIVTLQSKNTLYRSLFLQTPANSNCSIQASYLGGGRVVRGVETRSTNDLDLSKGWHWEMLWFNYVLHKGALIHPSHRFATSFGPISFGRQKTPQAPTDAYAFIRLNEERHYLTQIASFTSHLNLKMYHTELCTEL